MYTASMTDDMDRPAAGVISLRLEGEFADQIDRIAAADGVSRSEVLRRALLANLAADVGTTARWIRRLETIHDQLVDLFDQVEETEADDATNLLGEAVESTRDAINALEEFDEEEE